MSKRRSGRELAFRLLFQLDLGGGQIDDVFSVAHEQSEATPEVWEFASALARGAWQNRKASEASIERLASGWSLERMATADRNLLRLSIYEIDKRPDIPPSVSINEAVELAKSYSTPESARFINGILGNYLRSKPKEPEQKAPPGSSPEEALAE